MSQAKRLTVRGMLGRVHLRLILFAVLLSGASLVLSGGLVIRSYAQRNLELAARTVAQTVQPALVLGDQPEIAQAIASVAAEGGVRQVEVVDQAGRIRVQWQNPERGLPDWLLQTSSSLLWPQPTTVALTYRDVPIGQVRIMGNPEGLLRFALAGTIIALCCLAITVIAARILARRLQSHVIGPLEQVAEVAEAVRTQRAFDHRVPEAGIAEIDQFGQNFNALLAELQGWHATMLRENAELAEQALLDRLTGLGNRAAFEAALAAAVTDAVTSSRSFAVLYCDLDQFKAINDAHGHEAGDAALAVVAERLKTVLRHQDRAFRLGGDEFAVLLGAIGPGATVTGVVTRLHGVMAAPIALPGAQPISCGLSIGIAIYPDDGLSPRELLRRADSAMYRDKRSRNQMTQHG